MSAPAPMDLAAEDALRLHVLLAGEVHAVRIDESAPAVFALTPRGEARVPLHPNQRTERYLARVREVLGGHALGSPGGYPVYLERWTRMGQASAKNLEALLKLGEPEAVIAVAYAADLTDELARRAWWAHPTLEVARSMLLHPAVREGRMGPVLADWLVEHLPFEPDPVIAMHIVRAVLAPGLIDAARRQELWQKARRRPHYYVGFLEGGDADLPGVESGADHEPAPADPWAAQLARCRSAAGRAWLGALRAALDKPPAAETVYLLLDLLGGYFAALRAVSPAPAFIDAPQGSAMAAMARASAADAEPILARSSAVGPLMRKKLAPVIDPLLLHLDTLIA